MIKRAAVIGAGTMGAGIAAQLANAGVPCLLLDIVPRDLSEEEKRDPRARSRLATEAIQRMAKGRPPGFMSAGDQVLVETGNIEDDLQRIAECDWIVEAVPENLKIKRELYAKIASLRAPDAIVSSNTSGLSLSILTEGLDEGFRQHFLVTHFFNPPRYMFLLELVPGPDTKPEVFAEVERFCNTRLGKGVVHCKDTPNFIANRIGVYVLGVGVKLMEELGLSVEEVDAITGPVLGRPKTASFRLHDLVGIDVTVMVMENSPRLLPEDPALAGLETPAVLQRLLKEGRLGRKTGAGFYKKEGKEILVLDLETFEYRPPRPVEFESLAAAAKAGDTGARIKALINGNDAAANYAWLLISETLLYTAARIPEIADDIVSIDRALRWGFNWELGPFATWDAIGVRESVERMRADGREIPPLVEKMLGAGVESFYGHIASPATGGQTRSVYDAASGEHQKLEVPEGFLMMTDVKDRGAPVEARGDASIFDLGEGVLCVEFHSKMNAISGETLDTIVRAIDLAEDGGWAGVVVGNQAPNFSVGANLKQLVDGLKTKNWDAIDQMIRTFHRAVLRMRYSAKPVVVATQGMVLGGGCEVSLAGDRVQSAAESYIGLVELGVGLIPAGGGTRELACRAHERSPGKDATEVFPRLREFFDTVANARTSTSAQNARELGFLEPQDEISMNRDHVLWDARARVVALAEAGYRPPRPRTAVRVAGRPGWAELKVLLHQYRSGGFVSEYDCFLGEKFAYVLCGGDISSEYPVTEEYLLDLEREVFLELVAEKKTQERILHTLKTGKPLRN